MFCIKCGSQIPDGMKFCPSCGAPQQQAQQPQNNQQQYQQAPQQPQQPQYGGYGQPPKKSKGPIIAIIVVAALVVIGVAGFLIWRFVINKEDQTPPSSSAQSVAAESSEAQSQTQQSQAPSSSTAVQSQASSSAAATKDSKTIVYEYFKEKYMDDYNIITLNYGNNYGDEFGEFKTTSGVSGVVNGYVLDFDNDGDTEIFLLIWEYNTGTGYGYNRGLMLDYINGKVQEISCGRSAEYGNTDHTAQVLYEVKSDGAYFYYTTIYTVTTHEAGFCDPTAVVYKYTNGKGEQLLNTAANLNSESPSTAYLDSFSQIKTYLPEAYAKFAAAVNKNNYEQVCGWTWEKKDKIPFFGTTSLSDHKLSVAGINYFMRKSDDDKGIHDSYMGYWSTRR